MRFTIIRTVRADSGGFEDFICLPYVPGLPLLGCRRHSLGGNDTHNSPPDDVKAAEAAQKWIDGHWFWRMFAETPKSIKVKHGRNERC